MSIEQGVQYFSNGNLILYSFILLNAIIYAIKFICTLCSYETSFWNHVQDFKSMLKIIEAEKRVGLKVFYIFLVDLEFLMALSFVVSILIYFS